MGTLVGIIWIVIGVVYIIYKAFKENPKNSANVFLGLCVVGGWIIFSILIFNAIVEEIGPIEDDRLFVLSSIIICLLFFGVIIGIPFFLTKKGQKKAEEMCSPEKIEQRQLELRREIRTAFCDHNIVVSEEMIKRLVEDGDSPIYNQNGFKYSLNDCYWWMSAKRESELMYNFSDSQFDEVLGVPLRKIPLDQSVNIGEAVLERKALAVRYVLRRDGLDLPELKSVTMNYRFIQNARARGSNYPDEFEQYVRDLNNDFIRN